MIDGGSFEQYSPYRSYVKKADISLPLAENTYYFILNNGSTAAKDFDIEYSPCSNGMLKNEFKVSGDGENYVYYKLDIDTYGQLICTPTKETNVTYHIFDEYLNDVAIFKYENNCSFNITENAGNVLYIGFIVDGDVNFIINHTGVAYKWTIDDEVADGSGTDEQGIPINIGHSYIINFYINGIVIGKRFIFYAFITMICVIFLQLSDIFK